MEGGEVSLLTTRMKRVGIERGGRLELKRGGEDWLGKIWEVGDLGWGEGGKGGKED